jgi:hypothetical protein
MCSVTTSDWAFNKVRHFTALPSCGTGNIEVHHFQPTASATTAAAGHLP